ncbi:MAG: hypothetical protein L7F77_14340 [Candidatus Magnetominusculus sp. LBB02]|nr:hypothetical protein [Candidatus Magnetominusculus sp. LBB02]
MWNKKGMDTFWIHSDTWSLQPIGNFAIGETFFSVLNFRNTEIESVKSTTKSLKRVDIDLYEGVGRIFDISKGDYPALLFDCGIYAYRRDASLLKGIESGSFVKMRFYMELDDDYHRGYTINGEPLVKAIPEMLYDWQVKEILVLDEYDEYFTDLPVAYQSNGGKEYKSIRQTCASKDCGGDTEYVLVCQML